MPTGRIGAVIESSRSGFMPCISTRSIECLRTLQISTRRTGMHVGTVRWAWHGMAWRGMQPLRGVWGWSEGGTCPEPQRCFSDHGGGCKRALLRAQSRRTELVSRPRTSPFPQASYRRTDRTDAHRASTQLWKRQRSAGNAGLIVRQWDVGRNGPVLLLRAPLPAARGILEAVSSTLCVWKLCGSALLVFEAPSR